MTDDERAELEQRREFLLRSIEDLDAEVAAGDLSAVDHAALRDDYVARAAACERALEDQVFVDEDATGSGAPAISHGRARARTPLVVAACVSMAAVAGLFLASTVGARQDGAPATGSLPTGTNERLGLAARLMGEGKAVEAVKLYDQVLAEDPEHPVALAYRGWLVRLAGLKEEGFGYVDRAVESDPTYPDAHFFRGMMLWQDKADPAAAVSEFRLFLANRPPQQMVKLVEDALRKASDEAGLPAE